MQLDALWYNPLLPIRRDAHPGEDKSAAFLTLDPTAPGLEHRAKHRRRLLDLGFYTVGDWAERRDDLCDALVEGARTPPHSWRHLPRDRLIASWPSNDYERTGLKGAMEEVDAVIPRDWITAIKISWGRNESTTKDAAELTALRHFGWPAHPSAPSLPDLTVSSCTKTLVAASEITTEKHKKWRQFYQLLGADEGRAVSATPRRLTRLWKLPWDNHIKETYWSVLYNGLATKDRHLQHVCGCCMCNDAGRLHIFWDCPVAKALRDTIERQLGIPADALAIQHLLLMEPPPGTLTARPAEQLVWDVVCLAAIDALRRTHDAGYSRWFHIPPTPDNPHEDDQVDPDLDPDPDPPDPGFVTPQRDPRKMPTQQAIRLVRTSFWAHLHDFCTTAPVAASMKEALQEAQAERNAQHLFFMKVLDNGSTLEVRRI